MTRRTIESWLMDMDGVLVHEESAIPGANIRAAGLAGDGRPGHLPAAVGGRRSTLLLR